MSSPENPADQTPDPDSERASHSTKGDHIPQVRDVFKNLGVSIRNAFTKFFAGRASKLRAITFGSIGAFLATWGAFYYNNRHAPPSIAISLFCVGGMFGALTAWQVAKNFNWPDLIANICLVIVILVVFALTSLDWYFEYRHLRLKPPHFEITS